MSGRFVLLLLVYCDCWLFFNSDDV